MTNAVTECQKQIEIDQGAERLMNDDNSSIKSDKSQHSRQSVSSRSSSSSSRKEKLRAVLIARKKLELAKARAQEEAESARLSHEHKTKRELRRLEDESALAELAELDSKQSSMKKIAYSILTISQVLWKQGLTSSSTSHHLTLQLKIQNQGK